MMTETPSQTAPQPEHNERGLLCARCEHLNRLGQTQCEKCGAHLFVVCRHCGHENQRVHTRCRQCHRRLHGGLFHQRHHHHHTQVNRRALIYSAAAVLIVAGLVGAWFLMRFLNSANPAIIR